MMAVIIPSLCLLTAFTALIVAVRKDVESFCIPNTVSLAMVLSFVVYAATVLPLATIVDHGLVALAVFAITFILYLTNNFGAGDVKLLTALALWAGPLLVMPMVFLVALAGGLVSIFYLLNAKRKEPLKEPLHDTHTHISEQISAVEKIKIPYGVAIAAGGFFVLLMNSLPLIKASL